MKSALGILIAVVAVLAWKPLLDPDLGWHLASGLWIIDHLQVPIEDPFTVGAPFYLCYSWLFDIGIASLFRVGGFSLLQITQCFLALWSMLELWRTVHAGDTDGPKIGREERGALGPILAVLIILPLMAPLWHLRPQLFSAIFLLITLRWTVSGTGSFLRYLALTFLWSSVHVYWVVVPILYFIANRALLRAAILSLVPILGPYGIELYRGLFQYGFGHGSAWSLIREFQPLSFSLGYAPYLYGVLVVLLFILTIRRLLSWEFVILLLVFAVAGACRFKFLPLFAIMMAPFIPRLFRGGEISPSLSRAERVRVALACGLFFSVLLWSVQFQPALPEEREELLKLVSKLPARGGVVLNHFDDGGWLEFAIYLSGRRDLLVAFDGRTLVMGEERLQEFDHWRRGDESCLVTKALNPDYVVLPQSGSSLGSVYDSEGVRKCLGDYVPLRSENGGGGRFTEVLFRR